MNNSGQHENERHRMDLYRGMPPPWNMMPQCQMKEINPFIMNNKIMQTISEKNAIVEELNRAISIRNSAIEERNGAIKLRDEAVAARDTAYRERDSAIAALRFHESSVIGTRRTIKRGKRRMHHSPEYHIQVAQITDASPLSVVQSENYIKPRQEKTNIKESKAKVKTLQPKAPVAKSPKKGKRVGKDLNRQVTTWGSKVGWDAQDLGSMELINFDETTMPAPVCTCTGVPHHCYRWGNGGWQSSCCTTSLSVFPLPQLPNKRHRMGGRKMSGNVFARLLNRLVADGHSLSIPIDLMNYWAKHGTNRYVTIR